MNDEAQNVPDNEKAPDDIALTPATSTPAVSATPSTDFDSAMVEVGSDGVAEEPTPATELMASDVAPASDGEALQTLAAPQQIDDAVAADEVDMPDSVPAIEVDAELDSETPSVLSDVSTMRAETEDPQAVAEAIAVEEAPLEKMDEPVAETADEVEPAAIEVPVAVAETAAPEAVEIAEEVAIAQTPTEVESVEATEATETAETIEPIRSEVSEPVGEETTDSDVAVEPTTEVIDDNFILEKVAEAKAAKKKKVAAPRVRKPPKRGKQKLPDLGDGSGYEPPDTAGAPVVENADGSQSTVEVEEEALWYAVHCYSGYENKVKHSLEQRIETMGMAGRIMEVVVPTEEEIEVRDGKRKTVERRVFPGYVLVRMRMSEDSWHVVRNTPGVTRFIGMGNRPQPLSPQEVNQILRRMEAEAPKIKVSFKVGQKVRITDGPFADFMGLVDKIDTERAKVAVLVSFFGRETPVELDFLQVEKM